MCFTFSCSLDSESSNQRLSQLDDSNLDYSNQGSSFSIDTSNQGSVSMDTSFLGNSRNEQFSLYENSNQDSIATDHYQEMDSEVKGNFGMVNVLKFQTLYSILLCLNFAFVCSCFLKYLVEQQTV